MEKSKNGVANRIAFFVLIMIFYSSGTVYDFRYNQYSDVIRILLSLFCCFIFFFSINRYGINKHWLIRAMFIIISFVVLSLANGSNLTSIFGVAFRLIGMFAFTEYCYNTKVNLGELVYKLILYIAIIFLIMYFLFDVCGISNDVARVMLSTSNEKRNVATSHMTYTVYSNIYYRWQTIRLSFLQRYVPRCNGPFWEPGYYQIYLNLGLFYALFINQFKGRHVLLFILAILSTTSTMGMIIMFILLGLRVIKAKYNTVWKAALLFPLAVALVVVIFYTIKTIVVMKMYTSSYAVRTTDLYAWVKNWRPLIGDGLYSKGANMSGLINLVQEYGIIGSFIFYYPLKLCWIISRKYGKVSALAALMWFVFSYLNEPLTYHNVTLMLVGACISYHNISDSMNTRWSYVNYESYSL